MVVTEDSLAPPSEAASVVVPADVRSAQMTGDVRSQLLMDVGAAHQKKEGCEGVESRQHSFGQKHEAMTDAVCVSTAGKGYNDVMVRVEETMEKLWTENLSLHGKLVAERAAHARALIVIFIFCGRRRTLLKKTKRLRGCWL